MNDLYFDIVVVGASFSGLSFVRNLPKDSKIKVLIVEAKPSVGFTVESTGLITEHTRQIFDSFFEIDNYITNKITTIGVVTTDFEEHFFSSKEDPWIYQTDTKKLIQEMANNLSENVTLWTETIYIDNSKIDEENKKMTVNFLQKGNKINVKTKFLIGADGGSSKVALQNSLEKNKKFLFGIEEVYFGNILLGPNPEETIYHFWFGDFSLGYGGWLSSTIIDDKKAFRIGLAKKMKENKNAKELLKKFIQVLLKKNIINIDNSVDASYGVYGSKIPIGGPLKNIYKSQILLIGDAAGFCGAFAADGIKGSIISGIESAKLLVDYFDKSDDKVFASFLKNMNNYHNIITYYKKQVFYRFVWDRMKTNRTFRQMYKIIAKEKEGFLFQFCDSKEKGKGLSSLILKLHNVPSLVKYSWYIFIDFFKKI
ncbi:MAG: NAD(P)/FAD-dependent oxidoreductase [Candidatus Magasanikbacteria bacterium]